MWEGDVLRGLLVSLHLWPEWSSDSHEKHLLSFLAVLSFCKAPKKERGWIDAAKRREEEVM